MPSIARLCLVLIALLAAVALAAPLPGPSDSLPAPAKNPNKRKASSESPGAPPDKRPAPSSPDAPPTQRLPSPSPNAPLVSGQPLSKTPGLQQQRAKGRAMCQNYLSTTVYPEFKNKFLASHASSNLVHLNPTMGNTLWDSTGSVLTQFTGQETDSVDGPKYKLKVMQLTGKDTPMSVESMAERLVMKLYKVSDLC